MTCKGRLNIFPMNSKAYSKPIGPQLPLPGYIMDPYRAICIVRGLAIRPSTPQITAAWQHLIDMDMVRNDRDMRPIAEELVKRGTCNINGWNGPN